MAFIFSTSHLPETRLRRPDHLEEEGDEDGITLPPRAGGVRAFSHLPVPRPQPDRSGPLSTRPAIPVGRTRTSVDPEADIGTEEDRDADHVPGQDSNHDHDDVTHAHEYGNDTPWHMPRLTAQAQPPQVRDEDQNGPSLNRPVRDSSFDDAPHADRSTSTTRSSGLPPSAQDLSNAFHSPAPDSPAGEAPAQDNSPAMLRGRLFEKRLPPGFRAQGTGPLPSLADKSAYHDLVYRPGSAEDERHQAGGFFQNVADTRTTRQTPSSPKAPQTFAQSVRPAAQPAQKGGQTTEVSGTRSSPPAKQTPDQDRPAAPEMHAVNAPLNSESKSNSANADETPHGMDYALKFIGGSIVDTALNTAVALFGGPGKYSYNPNPLRRHWHVDGWLPKIDRESYNRLQTGAEMLAFSFAEASNPRNRILLAVPAPPWGNRDGSPLSREEANRWLKDYRSKVANTGTGEFHLSIENNQINSWLKHGTLIFEIQRPTKDGMMSGRDMFKSMIQFYGPAVKAIEGNWVDGDNLAKINGLTLGGTPLKSAVQMTWTAGEARRHGFTEVEINHSIGEDGKYTDIQVTFRKPGG